MRLLDRYRRTPLLMAVIGTVCIFGCGGGATGYGGTRNVETTSRTNTAATPTTGQWTPQQVPGSGAELANKQNTKVLPKIAVYVTGGKTDGENKALSARITHALVSSGRYSTIERSDAFLDQVAKEMVTQRSGAIDDRQISKLGQQAGASFVCVGEILEAFGAHQISARIVNVESVEVIASGLASGPLRSMTDFATLSDQVVGSLVGVTQNTAPKTYSAASPDYNKAPSVQNTTSNRIQTPTQSTTYSEIPNALNVNNVSSWNSAINTIRNGGNSQTYTINVIGNVSVPAPQNDENLFGSVTAVTVTILGNGSLTLSVNGSLLRVGAGQSVIVRNVKLHGRSDNNNPVVRIMSGGIFRMEGSAIVTGNTVGGGVAVDGGNLIMRDRASVTGNGNQKFDSNGGGVYIRGGTFTMQGGIISGNTARGLGDGGGGVYVGSNATFTMESGTISGNTVAVSRGLIRKDVFGGGVYVYGGVFTMLGGVISGNTAAGEDYYRADGGGVYVGSGTFTMKGGTISGGNNATHNGGGVYIRSGEFAKTGGTISGNDAALGDRNTASLQGHAVYLVSSPARWRNASAGPNDNTEEYGFWLND